MNYSEKLKDPRWQKKRLKIMERDDFTCQNCYREDISLNVHHLKYIKGREPWEYSDKYLVTLCEKCHDIADQIVKVSKEITWLIIFKGDLWTQVICFLKMAMNKITKISQKW